MKKTTKDEPKAARKSINWAKVWAKVSRHMYKFSAAVALTVAAYASFYNLFVDHLTDTPHWVAQAGAAVVTVGLVVVLAACDTDK